jgi:hypothetical protein
MSANRTDIGEEPDRRRIEENFETGFGSYWFDFDEKVRKLLVDAAIIKEKREVDPIAWWRRSPRLWSVYCMMLSRPGCRIQ